MKTIWKYHIEIEDMIAVQMPAGAQILDLQVQMGEPYLWALVDSDAMLERRFFRVFGTGFPVFPDDVLSYVGTFQLQNGLLVFHLFEVEPKRR